MPNIKSAEKRVRTSEKARRRNIKTKTKIKTLRKGLLASVAAPDGAKTPEAYRAFCSSLDKAAKQGIIHKNTAIRKKARAGAMLRKAAAAK
ncbi:MAG: 30S ribosomal protein S20 [Lentisphaerae bacterium]|nr:30S ribosomal protein S20 [Lentisphaerota bacterium]